ncbi:MAG TPA: hypothetical protein VNJ09_10855 [Chthonomonadales bacterium]|nr:hypothetical protein [Chthonomonadales bacterium]
MRTAEERDRCFLVAGSAGAGGARVAEYLEDEGIGGRKTDNGGCLMRGMEGIAVRGKALAAYWSVEVSEGSARADKAEWASRATVIATGWTALAGVAWLLHPIDAAWWRLVGTVGGCWALAVLMRRAPFASRAPVEAPPIGSAAGVAVERGEPVSDEFHVS